MIHTTRELSRIWTVWTPLLPVVLLTGLGLYYPRGFEALTYKEGPIEWATIVIALVGATFAGLALVRRRGLPSRKLVIWVALLFVGMIYMAGEESSWGQHIANPRMLGDPDTVKNDGIPNVDPRSKDAVTGEARQRALERLSWPKRFNDQGETNFHNLPGTWGSIFGQVPKQAVEFGSFIACVIVPVFFAKAILTSDPAKPAHWYWPTKSCMVTALIAFALPWPRRIVEAITGDEPPMLRVSEVQEFYLALVLTLYCASIAVRLKSRASSSAPAVNATEHASR